MEYLSKQRYDEIAAELRHLINEVYPKVKEDLAETRAQGDLSENAGYREARRIQAPYNPLSIKESVTKPAPEQTTVAEADKELPTMEELLSDVPEYKKFFTRIKEAPLLDAMGLLSLLGIIGE